MTVYENLGELVVSSRLRKISDFFFDTMDSVLQQKEVPFQARWFLIVYILKNYEHLSVSRIAKMMELSDSAVSQMVKKLIQKGMVAFEADSQDRRKKKVILTPYGHQVFEQAEPVWKAVGRFAKDLSDGMESDLLQAISEVDALTRQHPHLADEIVEQLEPVHASHA